MSGGGEHHGRPGCRAPYDKVVEISFMGWDPTEKDEGVNYLAEALYGDKVSANCEDTDGQTFLHSLVLHSLVRESDSLELFRARPCWEPTR